MLNLFRWKSCYLLYWKIFSRVLRREVFSALADTGRGSEGAVATGARRKNAWGYFSKQRELVSDWSDARKCIIFCWSRSFDDFVSSTIQLLEVRERTCGPTDFIIKLSVLHWYHVNPSIVLGGSYVVCPSRFSTSGLQVIFLMLIILAYHCTVLPILKWVWLTIRSDSFASFEIYVECVIKRRCDRLECCGAGAVTWASGTQLL